MTRHRAASPLREAALDTSVLYAILDEEDGAEALLDAFGRYAHLSMSAGTLAELSIVLSARRGPESITDLERLLTALGVEIVAVDHQSVQHLREGFVDFGKGMGNGARLNLGDLFAYALCREREIPLFFLGADFAQTDIADAMTA